MVKENDGEVESILTKVMIAATSSTSMEVITCGKDAMRGSFSGFEPPPKIHASRRSLMAG